MSANNSQEEHPNSRSATTGSSSNGGGGGGGAAAASANGNKYNSIIPMSRVKTIMKSSPEITNINPDTLFLVCKSTELFIKTFAKEAYKKSNKDNNLDYEKFANLVADEEKFQFLSEIVPFKIKAREALKLIETERKLNEGMN